jgi:regulator of cell morphogenesis and NO signaling
MREVDRSIGELAIRHPAAHRVLGRHGIDFCCRGAISLAEACAPLRLDPDAVLDEIAGASAAGPPVARRWDQAPLEELVEHLVTTFHRALPDQIRRLHHLAARALGADGAHDPGRLATVCELLDDLDTRLIEHMLHEEDMVFPWLQSANKASAGVLVRILHQEHDDVSAALRALRALVDGAPAAAGQRSWADFTAALEAFEGALREHMHLENNILFPRALAA